MPWLIERIRFRKTVNTKVRLAAWTVLLGVLWLVIVWLAVR